MSLSVPAVIVGAIALCFINVWLIRASPALYEIYVMCVYSKSKRKMRDQARNPYIQQIRSSAEEKEGTMYANEENEDAADDFAETITKSHDDQCDSGRQYLLPSPEVDSSILNRLFGIQRMR